MKRTNATMSLAKLTILALLCASGASAQQKDPRTNAPVAPLPPISTDSSSKAPAAEPATPAPQGGRRSNPLNGVDGASIGGGGLGGRTFIIPSLDVHMESQRSDPGSAAAANGPWSAGARIAGRLALQRAWSTGSLTMDYAGAGGFDVHNSLGSSPVYHTMQVAYRTRIRRWDLSVFDVFNYSPEGGYGGGLGNTQFNMGAGGFGGNNLVNLNPTLQQNQAIFGQDSTRIANTVGGQATFQFTPQTRMDFSAHYGMLHFLDPGFIDNTNIRVRAGYYYDLTPRDSIMVSFHSNFFRYDQPNSNNLNNVLGFGYNRQLTGKLSFHAAAGPRFSTVQMAPGVTDLRISWSMSGGLNYAMRAGTLNLNYHHGVTGGAGYLLGAESDEVVATYTRPITRLWTVAGNMAYTRNQSLRALPGGLTGQRFNSWRAGFQASRPLSRQLNLYFQYGLEHQTSRTVGCVGTSCAFIGTRHLFAMGLNFRFNTLSIE